jgi:hypothetical protein
MPDNNRTTPIRKAIACREYPKAKKLWTEYMAGLHRELRRGTLTSAQMEEARELVEWARMNVLCARAHIRKRLHNLQVARRYGAEPSPAPPSGRLRAHC